MSDIEEKILKALEEKLEFDSISELYRYLKNQGYDFDYEEVREAVYELEKAGHVIVEKKGRDYAVKLTPKESAMIVQSASLEALTLADILSSLSEDMKKLESMRKKAKRMAVIILIATFLYAVFLILMFGWKMFLFGTITGLGLFILLLAGNFYYSLAKLKF